MANSPRYFNHEKLDVFRVAIEFTVDANLIIENLAEGRRRGDLADQLHRASTSIVLNIAEGSGELSPRAKQRFYRIARRSAAECAAILTLIVAFELASEASIQPAREKLLRVLAMLTKMSTPSPQ